MSDIVDIIDHQMKYHNNLKFLKEIEDTEFNDWKTTVYFYISLHYINYYLRRKTKAKYYDIKTHTLLFKYLENNKTRFDKLDDIDEQYHLLYENSIKARYTCVKISERTVENQKDAYESILDICQLRI